MLLVIDNYDSFTYNLVQYLGELGRTSSCGATTRSRSMRSARWRPSAIVISPGPCAPSAGGDHRRR